MEFVSAADCERLLSLDDVVEAVTQALVWERDGAVTWPEPRNLNIIGDRAGNHYHVKACVLEAVPIAGVRLVSHPGDDDSGGGTRLIVLIDPATTKPVAMVDESWNYGQRTVASVVLAGAHVVRDATTVAIVGTGHLARLALTYVHHLLPDARDIRVTSRKQERRSRFVEWARGALGLDVTPTETVSDAVEGAQFVVTCTSAGRPLIHDADVAPGAVVVALDPAEIAPELAVRADHVFVDSREQLRKELVECWGTDAPDLISGTFADLLAGSHPGRTSLSARVVIVSQGLASQDVALANLAHERLRERTTTRA